MLTNQSNTTLQRLVVFEQTDGKDLIVYPIPNSLAYGKIGEGEKQWLIEASVYGEIERSSMTVTEFEDPELRKFSFENLVIGSYLELVSEWERKTHA